MLHTYCLVWNIQLTALQYNETVYNYAKFATNMIGGCLDQIAECRATNRTSFSDYAICSEAADMCRDNVESPYYSYVTPSTALLFPR